MHVLPTKRRWFATAAAATTAGVLFLPTAALADTETWTYEVRSYETGVTSGYQLALDPTNGRVYLTDAQWRSETARPGLLESDPFVWGEVDWDSVAPGRDGTKSLSQSSMRTTFSPYGIAIDGNLDGGTIVTTTARAQDSDLGFGGAIVAYPASQGAPTDADRIFEYADGTPVFAGVRRIAVDSTRHLAYVTNLGNSRGSGPEGYITVLDLTKSGAAAVLANVTIPEAVGAVGVTVDEDNNLIYVGSMAGEKLYVIDGNAIDTTNPRDHALNNDTITALDAVVGANARPTYNADLKRIYVSAYASPTATITAVDADPESATYGQSIDTIETGPSNAVEIDGQRGLLYSANLAAREVVIYDTTTHTELLRVPTSGNAVNIGIDPTTGNAWISNFSNSGIVDVISVSGPTQEPTGEPTEEPTDTPTEEPTGEPSDTPTDEPTSSATPTPTSSGSAGPVAGSDDPLPGTGVTVTAALFLAGLLLTGGLLARRRAAGASH